MKYCLMLTMLLSITWAQGPGMQKTTFDQADLFKEIYTFDFPENAGTNITHMYKGYLFILYAPDGGLAGPVGFHFYDITNPKAPKLVHELFDTNTNELGEAHGYAFVTHEGKDYAFFHGNVGIYVWDFTDLSNLKYLNTLEVPGISHTGYDDTAFSLFLQWPYVYVASSNHGVTIVDVTEPEKPKLIKQIPISKLGGFRVGYNYVVGNYMYLSSMDVPGISTVDLRDPLNPVLMATSSNDKIYAAIVYNNNIYTASRDGRMRVWDVSNPETMVLTKTTEFYAGNGEYIYPQDNDFNYGFGDDWIRIRENNGNFTALHPPMQLKGNKANEGHPIPFGNFTIVGDDHGTGTGIFPHQLEPDNKGPTINMVSPKEKALRSTKSRIGLTFSDNILLSTVTNENVIVREVGGERVSGKLTSFMYYVNFSPDVELKENTLYEIEVPAGGIKDWSGNPIAQTFKSQFSTGSQSQNNQLAYVPSSNITSSATGEDPNYPGQNATDGDFSTYWHSPWQGAAATLPQSLDITFSEENEIDGLRVTASPQNAAARVTQYEVLTSDNGVNYTRVASGLLPNTGATNTIVFPPTTTRHIRFVALKGNGENNFAGIAEVEVRLYRNDSLVSVNFNRDFKKPKLDKNGNQYDLKGRVIRENKWQRNNEVKIPSKGKSATLKLK